MELDPDCFVYEPDFLGEAEAERLLLRFRQELEWVQQDILMFGRRVPQPRLIAWYGDHDARYRYSGLSLEPLRWHPDLQELRERLEERTGQRFNSVLANAYRDGSDSMGWHRDDEKELGPSPCIASLSLGAVRRFLLRPRRAPGTSSKSIGIPLQAGSLLLMKGLSQARYEHSLPKTQRPVGLRINLTFRFVNSF